KSRHLPYDLSIPVDLTMSQPFCYDEPDIEVTVLFYRKGVCQRGDVIVLVMEPQHFGLDPMQGPAKGEPGKGMAGKMVCIFFECCPHFVIQLQHLKEHIH